MWKFLLYDYIVGYCYLKNTSKEKLLLIQLFEKMGIEQTQYCVTVQKNLKLISKRIHKILL